MPRLVLLTLLVLVAGPADAAVTCRKSYGGQTYCSDGTTIRASRNGSTYISKGGRQVRTCRQSRALGIVCEDR